jgi:hypothetical protein
MESKSNNNTRYKIYLTDYESQSEKILGYTFELETAYKFIEMYWQKEIANGEIYFEKHSKIVDKACVVHSQYNNLECWIQIIE